MDFHASASAIGALVEVEIIRKWINHHKYRIGQYQPAMKGHLSSYVLLLVTRYHHVGFEILKPPDAFC